MTERSPSRPVLRVLTGSASGHRVQWEGETRFSIGRNPSLDLVLSDEHISGSHAHLEQRDERLFLKDLGSTNGSRLVRAGRALPVGKEWQHIKRGDLLSLGDVETPVLIRVYFDEEEEDAHESKKLVAETLIGRVEDLEGRFVQDPAILQRFYRGLKTINQQLDLSAVVDAGMRFIFSILPHASHACLLLETDFQADPLNPSFTPVASVDRDFSPIAARPLSKWLKRKLLLDNKAVLASSGDFDGSESMQAAALESIIAAPLGVAERVVGVLIAEQRQGGLLSTLFGPRDLDNTLVVANHLALAVENARLVQRLRANEDSLQGENHFLKSRDAVPAFEMVGASPAMEKVMQLIDRVSDLPMPICITGETGTGKELVARAIHYRSKRRQKLFVAQNCAALPADLLESELFGHVKGAFTSADADKKGLFELADGGTIFLDEIGETSSALQAKLLRVLQEGEVRPVGATRVKRVDVRVVSATNRNLEEEVAEGRFREDLYYRLNVFPFHIPPLREREDDIRLLSEHFMRKYAVDFACTPLTFTPEVIDLFKAYNWPGNIRELQNEIQRILICRTHPEFVTTDALSQRIRTTESVLSKAGDDQDKPLKVRMANLERFLLIEALRAHNNNKTQTAKTLGITREGLHKKLSRYGIK